MKYCLDCKDIDYQDQDEFCMKCGGRLVTKPIDAELYQPYYSTFYKRNQKRIHIITFKIVVASVLFLTLFILCYGLFGFNSLILTFPIFIAYVFWLVKTLSFQLDPSEMGDTSYVRWLKSFKR